MKASLLVCLALCVATASAVSPLFLEAAELTSNAPAHQKAHQEAHVMTQAAALGAGKVNAIAATSSNHDAVATMAVETKPGVRIIGGDKCGCPEGQTEACHNPCEEEKGAVDEIERALDGVKTRIVNEAKEVQSQNLWTKHVKEIIKHYEKKMHSVEKDNEKRKELIKKLFMKKKHYEDLLLQYQLDRAQFKKTISSEKAEALKHDEEEIDKVEAAEKAKPGEYVFRDPADWENPDDAEESKE